ncbi:hypothetical protein CerSpe_249500 [Prunus speciosa]
MAKAYDRVEWPFFEAMMLQLGFDGKFCHWIMKCVSTVNYSIMLNGGPTRGIRQGDPLSPFLFLICAEGLSAMIKEAEEFGGLHGYQFKTHGTSVSHLFFADDSVLFCKAEDGEVELLKHILRGYEHGSGQRINLDKSSMFFSTKCLESTCKHMADILGVQRNNGFGKYLGLRADFGASKKAVFEGVHNRLTTKLIGWSEQYLT